MHAALEALARPLLRRPALLGRPRVASVFTGGLAATLAIALSAPAGWARPQESTFDAYHSEVEIASWLERCVARGAASVQLGQGASKLAGLEFGPGLDRPVHERRTVLLVGALDGVTRSGSEAVVAVVEHLFGVRLPDDLTVVALPLASPTAPTTPGTPGTDDAATARAYVGSDADGDGAIDEDGPDDLDGDGFVVDMLVEDPFGALARDESTRLVRPATRGDDVRLERFREGRDDDGDGHYNEDGVDARRLEGSFPIGWSASRSSRRAAGDLGKASLPLAEPAARALADFVFGRRTLAVIVFQGNHGSLARPGGTGAEPWEDAEDALWFDRAAGWFAEATGRDQERAWSLAEAHGDDAGGRFVDWCFAVPGVFAVEIAPWGPQVALGSGAPGTGGPVPPPVTAEQREALWERWLDDERAGLGFVPWHVVELAGGQRAWVGGWQPQTVQDPPVDRLASSLEGLGDFASRFVDSLPELDPAVRVERGEDGLSRVAVSVVNRGQLPTSYSTTGRHPERAVGDVVVELRLVPGARLLTGDARVSLPPLPGGARSGQVEWLVFAPRGTRLELSVRSLFCAESLSEVQL